MDANLPKTSLLFQHDGDLHTNSTTVLAAIPFSSLDEADRQLHKQAEPDRDHAIVTAETIFHPQGGGQPSDTGTMKLESVDASSAANAVEFSVDMVRASTTRPGIVLHFGHFTDSSGSFPASARVLQEINSANRTLYSRYHTAGHVLGASVRHLLQDRIPGFDELKASHFPDSASCEFRGLIQGAEKEAIQAQLDSYIAANMPVTIEWWDEADFQREGLERLLPAEWVEERKQGRGDEKLRIVRIEGAEVYPCGGTHVPSTKFVEGTKVRKIARAKGMSKVSYVL